MTDEQHQLERLRSRNGGMGAAVISSGSNYSGGDKTYGLDDFISAVRDKIKSVASQLNSSDTLSRRAVFTTAPIRDCKLLPSSQEVQVPLRDVGLITSVRDLLYKIDEDATYVSDLAVETTSAGPELSIMVRLSDETIRKQREVSDSLLRTSNRLPARQQAQRRRGPRICVIMLLYTVVLAVIISLLYAFMIRPAAADISNNSTQ